MNYSKKFFLNKKEDLNILSNESFSTLCMYHDIKVEISSKSNQLLIGDINIFQFLKLMNEFLRKALTNNLLLDNSLENNPGNSENRYMDSLFNKHSNAFFNIVKKKSNTGDDYWIGYDYALCGFRHRQAWIYNDIYGNIVFEITPHYYSQTKKRKKRMDFECWMKKTYKPILRRIVKKEIAQKWLEQVQELLSIIQHNSR